MAKLLVHESGGETREFELVDAEVHIGRELDNTLRLPDPSISRHHCVVRKTASGYEIQDLQSSNGVVVNGTRTQSSPLRNGDRITLGQIQLSFQSPDDEGATVAIKAGTVPDTPVGTVRMSAEAMAALHGSGAPSSTSPMVATPPAAPAASEAPTPISNPAVPPMEPPPMAPPPMAPPPVMPLPAAADVPPIASTPAPRPAHSGPLPEPVPFLASYLPPIPDEAEIVGPADIGDRLVAGLIDYLPTLGIWIVGMVLAVVCAFIFAPLAILIWLGVLAAILGYSFVLLPLCLVRHGATPGKKMRHLRVHCEGQPGKNLEFTGAILHQFGAYIWIVQIILIAVNNGKGLSNILGKSDVVKVDR